MCSAILLLVFAQATPDFRGSVALVHVDVEVREGERVLEDLTAASFRVSDNGKNQPIVNFAHAEESLDLILLLDTSDSMQRVVQRVASVARTTLGELRTGDRVAVMDFHCSSRLVLNFSADFSAVAQTITDGVLTSVFGGCSEIQKSLAEAAEPFRRQGQARGRRAIVIVTDDKGSRAYRGAERSLWEVDAVVLCVIVARPGDKTRGNYSSSRYMGAREIAEKTGGDSIETADAGDGLAQTIRRLRSRYSLYYEQPEAKPGSERKIKVQLAPEVLRQHRDAVVRNRGSYLVPGR